MNKRVRTWWSLMVLSMTTLLVMGGCGGGGGGGGGGDQVSKPTISGSVSFPTLNSLVAKRVADAPVSPPTIELHDLNGVLVKTMAATGAGTQASPYRYSFGNLDSADYVVKAFAGSQIITALVNKAALTTTTEKNINTITTTAVIIAEQTLGVPPGTLGVAINSISSDAIASVQPQTIEDKIVAAVTAIKSNPATATQDQVNLVNLGNVVNASVKESVDPASFIAGTATAVSVTTTQYTFASAAVPTAAPVTQADAQTVVAATTPVNGFIQYRTTENSPYVFGWIAADTSLYTSGKLFDSTDAIVQSTSATGAATYKSDAKLYDCFTGSSCIAGTPYQDMGWTINLPADFAAGTYNFELKTNTVNVKKDNLLQYAAGYSVPVIKSAYMTVTNTSTDIQFSWVNPTTDANWSSVNKIRLELQDSAAADKKVVIDLKPSATSVSLPRAFVTQAGINLASTTLQWHMTTRQGVNGVNVARGISNWKSLPVYVPPVVNPSANALKESLKNGWYEFRSDSTYNQATNSSTNYYYIDRIGLSADEATMTSSISSYLDPVTKTWSTVKPAGFPTQGNNSSDYSLNASGSWVVDDGGPDGYPIVFNSDGTSTITNSVDGSMMKAVVSTTSIAGQTLPDGPQLLSTATTFPSGSELYGISITSLNDSYMVWHNGGSTVSTLAAVPAAYAENSTSYGQIYIDSNGNNNNTDYFYGKFVNGSTTNVNIYRGIQNSTTQAAIIGTATATTSTVRGQQIMEISIPTNLVTTYNLTSKAILAVVNGIVMQGTHSPAGYVDPGNSGGGMLNDVAINYLKANINTAVLPKQVVAKKISKSLLGF